MYLGRMEGGGFIFVADQELHRRLGIRLLWWDVPHYRIWSNWIVNSFLTAGNDSLIFINWYQADWVCDDDWRPNFAQSMFFAGAILGSLLYGLLVVDIYVFFKIVTSHFRPYTKPLILSFFLLMSTVVVFFFAMNRRIFMEDCRFWSEVISWPVRPWD